MRNVVIIALLIAALGGGYWYFNANSHPLPIASGDSIESWDFQGSHKDGGANEQRVADEIVRLEAALKDPETEPTDYAVHIGLSNQYVLLGDGKAAYAELEKALAIDAEKTGLAWHNMGTLMERLGAINTARIAFDKAVEAQPVVEVYHVARFQFLMKYFPEDASSIEASLQKTQQTFGEEYPPLMQLKYEWLSKQGKQEEAAAMLKMLQERIQGPGGGSAGALE